MTNIDEIHRKLAIIFQEKQQQQQQKQQQKQQQQQQKQQQTNSFDRDYYVVRGQKGMIFK